MFELAKEAKKIFISALLGCMLLMPSSLNVIVALIFFVFSFISIPTCAGYTVS